MESIKWITEQQGQKGQQRQLEFGTEAANTGVDKPPDEQDDLAGLYRVSAGANRSDSWVDATVTLLATIVFGLGWAVVELEGADPLQARYDQAVQADLTDQTDQTDQAAWSSNAIDTSMMADTAATESTRSLTARFRVGEMWGAERERWTDDMATPAATAMAMAPRSSKQ